MKQTLVFAAQHHTSLRLLQTLNDAYKKELIRFDQDRALTAWDALASKQQEQLQRLGVPTMFSTKSKTDLNVSSACLVMTVDR